MMITPIELTFVLLVVWAVMLDRAKLSWLLSTACCFIATGGIIVAGQNVQNYYIVATALIGLAALGIRQRQILGLNLRDYPGLAPLVAFGLWTLLVTITAPFIFAGTRVLNPRDGIDDG
ncbi:hypothetical protein NSX62_23605, partial [Escherichia coli]|uniref:hypothetical protein n=1 Tax=Escherichia coli TaxID=562 RepID=UPI00214D12F8